MATDNKYVKDYLGDLVPKAGARKIMGKYYVENVSCFLIEGQWYRITSTDKIVFDNYVGKYVLKSTPMVRGVVNGKGEEGLFSENPFIVRTKSINGDGRNRIILNEKIAKEAGYVESISDGLFYKESEITEKDKAGWFSKKNIPSSERSKDYNLESNPKVKERMIRFYNEYVPKIRRESIRFSKLISDFTIGCEVEVINGFLPERIRTKLGIAALKDGSLRWDGGEGIEYCTMPMKGSKAIATLTELFDELSKRCEVNNLCALHYHFGNVRKDKLYVLSLYRLIYLLQNELYYYFPYSRFNTIKSDGKVYCKLLSDLGINYNRIIQCKDEEEFHEAVVNEFNKVYAWLNNGKGLAEDAEKPRVVREVANIGGKKMFRDVWYKKLFTTKSNYHSIQGEKWNRTSRYFVVNFLNLFFSPTHTVEWRCHEGTVNKDKALTWLIICASVMRYAENIKECLSLKSITLQDILKEYMTNAEVEKIMNYLKKRNSYFFTSDGKSFKSSHADVEKKWFKEDPTYKI